MPQCLNASMPKWPLIHPPRSPEVTWGHTRSKLTIYEYSYTNGDHSDIIRNLRSQRSLRSLRLKSPKKVKITVKNAIKKLTCTKPTKSWPYIITKQLWPKWKATKLRIFHTLNSIFLVHFFAERNWLDLVLSLPFSVGKWAWMRFRHL